jgi:hypothetical protein
LIIRISKCGRLTMDDDPGSTRTATQRGLAKRLVIDHETRSLLVALRVDCLAWRL